MPEESLSLYNLDINDLHHELQSYVKQYGKWSERLVDAKKEVERRRAEFEFTEAELDKEIRIELEKQGKVTEGRVANTIRLQERYRAAQAAYLDARYTHDRAGAVVSALDHKGRALGKIVDLRLADYFSEARSGAPAIRQYREQGGKEAFNRKPELDD